MSFNKSLNFKANNISVIGMEEIINIFKEEKNFCRHFYANFLSKNKSKIYEKSIFLSWKTPKYQFD